MMNPETSDPNDPETKMWWVWIPVFIALFMAFMALVFGRDAWYETVTNVASLTRLT